MATKTATKPAPRKSATATAAKAKTTAAKAKAAPATAPAKAATRKTPATSKTTAKAATGAKTTRAAKAKVQETPVKKTPVYPASIADKKPWQSGAKVNKRTGFTEGTISDKIASALIKGGTSRADIVNTLPDLPSETRKGTKFQAANVAATVERQMLAMGFQRIQSYKLVPPKRAAK
jgi:hypothetical protein